MNVTLEDYTRMMERYVTLLRKVNDFLKFCEMNQDNDIHRILITDAASFFQEEIKE